MKLSNVLTVSIQGAVAVFFLGLTLLSTAALAGPYFGEVPSAQLLTRVHALPEQQLGERLGELLAHGDFRDKVEFEAILTEIVRRGRSEGEILLRRQCEALNVRKIKWYADKTRPGSWLNLELLTALRRLQGRPDPLTILVDAPGDSLSGTPLSLPRLKVTIKNVDTEKQEVGFAFGGNYRSGRQARWRLVILDAGGRPVPVRRDFEVDGGGIFTEGVLKPGQSWETTLEMRHFIESPLPGKYQVQVLYHNTRTIVDMEDISGLIVSKSSPIPMIVQPTVIKLTEEERNAARTWIAAIKPQARVKVVVGSYGKWAHDFISPDSPQGKLLSMGLKAAPALVEALQQETSLPEKRAHILSLLYSLTGENDPRRNNALGSHTYIEGSWQIWGGAPRERPSGGMGFGSRGWSWGGKPDVQAQRELTKKWVKWLRAVEWKVTKAQ